MRIFTVLFITNFIAYGVFAKPDCKVKLQQCENKKPPPRRQVCGTDNKTYPNRCALLRLQCTQNIPLEVKHRGKCKEKQPCWMDQECSADGTYAPVQCQKSLGYCWCVTANGRMIPDTTVHHRRPECPKRGRRTFSAKNTEGKNSSRKGCDQIDRDIFVKNLLRIFKTEYNRDALARQSSSAENQTDVSLEIKAVQWKFLKLDKDKNGTLTRTEYRELRRLIKKVVKPRRCSRTFVRLCDTDQNAVLSKQEWSNCLNVISNQETIKTTTEDSSAEAEVEAEAESEEGYVDTLRDPSSVLEESGVLPLNDHTVNDDEEDTGKALDCVSDRKAAMDEYKTQEIFVPECTPDGRYNKVQCFRSTGYCWCVTEDTGRPIPGTSSKDAHPNCDTIPKPMKGCPDHKKISFIKDLMEFFKHNMSNANLDDTVNTKDNQRTHEYAASLGFYGLDTNKNKVLEKKEWKLFRSMMSTNKALRRCGRKLPRYCDANHDKKINITEWLQCLDVQNPNTFSNLKVHPSPSNPRRRGPNPIQSFLKEDK